MPNPTTLNRSKTTCPKGHPYTGLNTAGSRICGTCKRDQALTHECPDCGKRIGRRSRRCQVCAIRAGAYQVPHPPQQRDFWAFVEKSEGCWIWRGSVDVKGYGAFGGSKAYRLTWRASGRTLEKGKHLHHECGVKLCVNPDHLSQVTHAEHAYRHFLRRLDQPCPNGHAAENYRISIDRGRRSRTCLLCAREHKRAYKRRQRQLKAIAA